MRKTFLTVITFSFLLISFSCKKNKDDDKSQAENSPAADSTKTIDNGWPREVANNDAKLVYYQPQVDDWKDFKNITARIAFSLTPKDGKEVLGVVSLKAGTLVDKDTRKCVF